jgi:hypothetical protein
MDAIVSWLSSEEPDYPAAARDLGPEAGAALAEIAGSDDIAMASKASTLAGFLAPETARPALFAGSEHRSAIVRVAVAGSLSRQHSLAPELGGRLLRDSDAGVRKWALIAIRDSSARSLVADVGAAARSDPEPALRQLASEVEHHLNSNEPSQD